MDVLIGQTIFYIAAFACYGYVFLACREIDVFLVTSVASLLVFLSAFFGFVIDPRTGQPIPLAAELYWTFGIFLGGLFFAALLNDRNVCKYKTSRLPKMAFLELAVLSGLFILLVALFIEKHGVLVFSGSKRELVDQTGSLFVILKACAAILMLGLVLTHRLKNIMFAGAVGVFTLAMGARSPVAIAVISYILIRGARGGRVSIIRHHPLSFVLSVSFLIFVGAVLKPAYAFFRLGGISEVIHGFSRTDVLDLFVRGAEFLKTQFIFNEMIYFGFETSGMHLVRAPLSLLPIPRSLYTTPSSEFNDMFQPILFPEHEAGMAYNPFAEFYVVFGLPGALVLVALWMFGLLFLNHVLRSSNKATIVIVAALAGALISFYFFRCSAAVFLALVRNYFYILGAITIAAQVLRKRRMA